MRYIIYTSWRCGEIGGARAATTSWTCKCCSSSWRRRLWRILGRIRYSMPFWKSQQI